MEKWITLLDYSKEGQQFRIKVKSLADGRLKFSCRPTTLEPTHNIKSMVREITKQTCNKVYSTRQTIEDRCIAVFGNSLDYYKTKSRKESVRHVRQWLSYVIVRDSDISLVETGKIFGQHHSTIISSLKVIDDALDAEDVIFTSIMNRWYAKDDNFLANREQEVSKVVGKVSIMCHDVFGVTIEQLINPKTKKDEKIKIFMMMKLRDEYQITEPEITKMFQRSKYVVTSAISRIAKKIAQTNNEYSDMDYEWNYYTTKKEI